RSGRGRGDRRGRGDPGPGGQGGRDRGRGRGRGRSGRGRSRRGEHRGERRGRGQGLIHPVRPRGPVTVMVAGPRAYVVPQGRQSGSRPISPRSRSWTGASAGTGTGGPYC